MAKLPTYEEMGKKIAEEALDEYIYKGKTLREWVELLAQTRWIPVSERLPEDMQFVLMTIRRMSRLYNHKPFITVGYISWNQTAWWCARDGDCTLHEIEVIAWMPLPEIYKEESEDKELKDEKL